MVRVEAMVSRLANASFADGLRLYQNQGGQQRDARIRVRMDNAVGINGGRAAGFPFLVAIVGPVNVELCSLSETQVGIVYAERPHGVGM